MAEIRADRRRLPLQGGRNFRDVGGYATTDGRRVRWGRVYRSGAMTGLTQADRSELSAFGIRTICDFRSPSERRREPTHWDSSGSESLYWDYEHAGLSLRGLLLEAGELSAAAMRQAMLRLYRRLPLLFAAPYAALFGKLTAGAVPLLFHCAAGKDRTGVAAALILTSLGVPREAVIEDYTLTNSVIDLDATLTARPRTNIGLAIGNVHLSDISREVRAPLLEARAEYLAAAFGQIERDHGSVAGYVAGALGVTEAMLRELRRHLLEE